MSIGSRIRHIRMRRGLTQKELGLKLGFSEATADARIAQYESDLRVPRAELMSRIAKALNVSVDAIVIDTKSSVGILHSFFALEDESLFRVGRVSGKTVILIDEEAKSDTAKVLRQMLEAWLIQSLRYENGSISGWTYDNWRYQFPGKNDGHYIDGPITMEEMRDILEQIKEIDESSGADARADVEPIYAPERPEDLDPPEEFFDGSFDGFM